jgi:hypothetical protein
MIFADFNNCSHDMYTDFHHNFRNHYSYDDDSEEFLLETFTVFSSNS